MADRVTPKYMPRELADEIRHWAPPELDSDEVWRLLRITERAYAQGYDDGHRAGFAEGLDYNKRPNSNTINRLRAAVLAEPEGGTND